MTLPYHVQRCSIHSNGVSNIIDYHVNHSLRAEAGWIVVINIPVGLSVVSFTSSKGDLVISVRVPFRDNQPALDCLCYGCKDPNSNRYDNQFLDSAADKNPKCGGYILNLQASWASFPGQV